MVNEQDSSATPHGVQRIPLVGRFAGLVLILMLVVVVGVIGIRRAGAAQAACLQVDAGDSRTLIDIQNGFRANGQGQDPLRRSNPITHVDYSPDQRYMAYLENDDTCNCSTLSMRPVTWASPAESILVGSDLPEWTRLSWSPDSQSIFYYWTDPSGAYTMGIASVDGQEHQVTTVGSGMIPYGWSADGAYFAFGERSTPTDPVTLALWSRAEGQITDLGLKVPALINNPDAMMVAWASVGHQLAFLSPDAASKNHLFLVTPGSDASNQPDNKQTEFDISGIWAKAKLFWSPGGHYVALTTMADKTRTWQLDIFGVQGEQFLGVSTGIVGQTAYAALMPPESAWDADGRSFVYMEYDTPTAPSKAAHLMVFHSDSGKAQVLLPQALPNWFAFADREHVETAWQQPAEAVFGLVDVLTGTKLALSPLSRAGVYPVMDSDPFHLGSALELSPDGNIAAMLLRQPGGSMLELAATDGSWRRDVPVAIANAQPTDGSGPFFRWSPDSQFILVTYSMNSMTAYRVLGRNILNTSIDVIGLSGLTTYHDTYTSQFLPQISWSDCRVNGGN